MLTHDTLYLIPLLPLLGAAILGLIGSRISKDAVTVIALTAVFGSFALCVVAATRVYQTGGALENHLWSWIAVGRYSVDLTFGFDQLTATLMLVVTGVGFLIHVYSVGYMHDDPAYWRYFCYLNLFIFAMSILVLGRSLPVMFIGWEGVGLASYLLIGFWYTDLDKAAAGKKAFIVNRVGDFGFLIGIFTLLGLFGTVDFIELRNAVTQMGGVGAMITGGVFDGMTVETVIAIACIALFVGACGKSAQIPLFVWLPDAMAGPTPVSALIHAATMVTAGVYMLARLSYLYDPALCTGEGCIATASQVVAWVGALTAVFAASIGLAQNDIKKVLAYSTVSQLGYMFLAAGVGAHVMAVFHLVTHAFFKACLFLGSGAVIHALHGEQDMRRMGGLRKLIPVVHGTFLVSTLAIAGIPPFAGFFSKDAILAHAFETSKPLGWVAVIGAVMTAFYMSRCVSLTFYGEMRTPDEHTKHHLHKPGWSMKAPLIILATLAAVAGALNLPHIFVQHPFLDGWLQGVVQTKVLHAEVSAELFLMFGSTLLAAGGLGLAYAMYRRGPSERLERLTQTGAGRLAHSAIYNKWFIDEIYDMVIVRPIRFVGRIFAIVVDPWIIDGILVKLIPGVFVQGGGRLLRKPQTGNVQAYATMFVVAAGVVSAWALWTAH